MTLFQNKALGVAFLVALVLQCFLILSVPTVPVSDAAMYFDSAISIAKGLGYQYHGQPTAYLPVGYPAFLGGLFWIFGVHIWVGQLANVLMSLASAYLFYKIALHLRYSKRTALIAFILVAFYPQHIALSLELVTEPIILFLSTLAIWLLLKYAKEEKLWLIVASGIVFGFSALIKPQLVPVAFFILFLLLRKKGFVPVVRACAIVGVLAGLIVIPWTVRNYRVFHKFIAVSTNGANNLLVGNSPYANGGYEEKCFSLVKPGDDPGKIAMDYIKTHPLEILKLLPKKFSVLYFDTMNTGLEWVVYSAYPKELSESQYRFIEKSLKTERDKSSFVYAYQKRSESDSVYVLRKDLNDIQLSEAANAVLYSGGWTPSPGSMTRFLHNLLLVWYAVIMLGGLMRITHVHGIPLVMFFQTTAVYLVFYGGFRYNYLVVPWFALLCAIWLAQLSPKVFARTAYFLNIRGSD